MLAKRQQPTTAGGRAGCLFAHVDGFKAARRAFSDRYRPGLRDRPVRIEGGPAAGRIFSAPGYRIDRVAVYNRVDGWFDDCLPLVVEFSTDGAKYSEVARRDQHFAADPPWSVDGKRELARYVRVRLARRGYLALSEVEVFGRAP